jgi:hypothetical protein
MFDTDRHGLYNYLFVVNLMTVSWEGYIKECRGLTEGTISAFTWKNEEVHEKVMSGWPIS